MTANEASLPRLETPGMATRVFSVASIMAAVALIMMHLVRLLSATHGASWWMAPVALVGMCAADLLSGVVHWGADTWGRETMPVLGKRLLRPFRVHHVNPADFLRRHWIETNGDVAAIVAAVMALAWMIPPHTRIGQVLLAFVLAMGVTGLPTNQVHQWAHMRHPPRTVRALQSAGVLLSREQHAMHHEPPHLTNYCIALGWCNGMIVRAGLFPRLERIIERVTGAVPRADERAPLA